MKTKTDERIVSKGRYVRLQGKRAGMDIVGLGLLGTAVLALLFMLWCLLMFILCLIVLAPDEPLRYIFLSALLSVVVVCCCGWSGYRLVLHATEIDPGVPLTQSNAADLPTHDTLVRASSEPLQSQEAVLLRAANTNEPTEPQELLRASHASLADC